jgi:hypothetical protein
MRKAILLILVCCALTAVKAQIFNFGPDEHFIKGKQVVVFGVDTLMSEQERYIVESNWGNATQLSLGVTPENLADTTVIFVATAQTRTEGQVLLFAAEGSGKWSTREKALRQGSLKWSEQMESDILAGLYISESQLTGPFLPTYLLGLRDMMNVVTLFDGPDSYAMRAYELETVPVPRKVYVLPENTRSAERIEDVKFRSREEIERVMTINEVIIERVFDKPKADAFFLDRGVYQQGNDKMIYTVLYKINGGVQFALSEPYMESRLSSVPIPYLRYLCSKREPIDKTTKAKSLNKPGFIMNAWLTATKRY